MTPSLTPYKHTHMCEHTHTHKQTHLNTRKHGLIKINTFHLVSRSVAFQSNTSQHKWSPKRKTRLCMLWVCFCLHIWICIIILCVLVCVFWKVCVCGCVCESSWVVVVCRGLWDGQTKIIKCIIFQKVFLMFIDSLKYKQCVYVCVCLWAFAFISIWSRCQDIYVVLIF